MLQITRQRVVMFTPKEALMKIEWTANKMHEANPSQAKGYGNYNNSRQQLLTNNYSTFTKVFSQKDSC